MNLKEQRPFGQLCRVKNATKVVKIRTGEFSEETSLQDTLNLIKTRLHSPIQRFDSPSKTAFH